MTSQRRALPVLVSGLIGSIVLVFLMLVIDGLSRSLSPWTVTGGFVHWIHGIFRLFSLPFISWFETTKNSSSCPEGMIPWALPLVIGYWAMIGFLLGVVLASLRIAIHRYGLTRDRAPTVDK